MHEEMAIYTHHLIRQDAKTVLSYPPGPGAPVGKYALTVAEIPVKEGLHYR